MNDSKRLMMYLFDLKIKHLLREHPDSRSIIELAVNNGMISSLAFSTAKYFFYMPESMQFVIRIPT